MVSTWSVKTIVESWSLFAFTIGLAQSFEIPTFTPVTFRHTDRPTRMAQMDGIGLAMKSW